jgi:hypothetical protein
MADTLASTVNWFRLSSIFNTPGDENTVCVTCDNSGNAYFGYLTKRNQTQEHYDVGIVQLNSSGSVVRRGLPLANNDPTLLSSALQLQEKQSIVSNPNGGVFIAGTLRGKIFNSTNSGSSDVYIMSLNPGFGVNWIKQNSTFNTSDDVIDVSIGVGSDACPVIAFTSKTNTNYSKVVVCKFSTTGTLLWKLDNTTINAGSNFSDKSPNIVVDSNNSIFMTYQTNKFLGNNGSSQGTYWVFDTIIAKLDASGSVVWKKQEAAFNTLSLGNTDPKIQLDASGNVYVAFITRGAIPDGVSTGYDIILTKLNPSGVTQWAVQQKTGMDTTYEIPEVSLAIDLSNNCILSYLTKNALSPATQTNFRDVTLTMINKDGFFLTNRQEKGFNLIGNQTEVAVDVNSAGKIVVGYVVSDPITTQIVSGNDSIVDIFNNQLATFGASGGTDLAIFNYTFPVPLTTAELTTAFNSSTTIYNNYNTNIYQPAFIAAGGSEQNMTGVIAQRNFVLNKARVILQESLSIDTIWNSINALDFTSTITPSTVTTLEQTFLIPGKFESITQNVQAANNTGAGFGGANDFVTALIRCDNALITSQYNVGRINGKVREYYRRNGLKTATSRMLGPNLPPPVLFNTELLSPQVIENIGNGTILNYGTIKITCVDKGTWDPNTIYTLGDLVRYPDASGRLHMCIIAPDPNGVYAGSINNRPV